MPDAMRIRAVYSRNKKERKVDRKKAYTEKKVWQALLLAGLLVLLASESRDMPASKEAGMAAPADPAEGIWYLYAGAPAAVLRDGPMPAGETQTAEAMAQADPTAQIYTFLQGPKSWGEGRTWSGEWSEAYVNGNYFGNFGCGLCCMANIYSSLTEYTCSPWDMFERARAVSGYSPTRKVGAIGWADMKVTLRKSGFDCALFNKADRYEQFQEQIREAQMAVVLVCSADDDTFWENTGGHYVTISLYNQDTDEVFLADPGGPDRNRTWIPLRYVYDALKTSSQYQYLLVNGYAEEDNQWKQDGIDEAWVEPAG